MSFLSPALLGLLALAIPLVLLYILKLRRRDIPVPSTLLWERAVRDLQANSPFQRLRTNLLLLLQLLLLILLALALARPALKRATSPGKVVVLVIDTSASMGASLGKGTRLDAAKLEALAALDRLGDGDEAMVVEAWSGARVAAGLSRDKLTLERAVEMLEVRDTPTRVDEALLLAATTVEKRSGSAILLFSDGAGVKIPAHPLLETSLTWIKSGEGADNIGITAFSAEPVVGPDGRTVSRYEGGREKFAFTLFAGVSNFSMAPRRVYATLRAEGADVAVRALDLAAGETAGAGFEALLPDGIAVEVALDDGGALACDDRAWTRVSAPGEVRVQVSGDQKFLRAFLATRPGLQIVDDKPDLWFGEGDAASPPPGAHVVWFRPTRSVAGVEPGEESLRVKALSWDETHPLLRFARFADVHVSRASRLTLTSDAVNLVQGSAGPLLAVASERGLLRVVVGFLPAESDWPLRPSFPIFLANVIRDVAALRSAEIPAQLASGTPARFAAAAKATQVTTPDGTKETLVPAESGEAIFGATDRAGLYTAQTAGGPRAFGVNLLSEQESNLSPPGSLGSGATNVPTTSSGGRETRDLWPWLAGAALLLFLVEWACFHRRIA